jgi:hypothetical protein
VPFYRSVPGISWDIGPPCHLQPTTAEAGPDRILGSQTVGIAAQATLAQSSSPSGYGFPQFAVGFKGEQLHLTIQTNATQPQRYGDYFSVRPGFAPGSLSFGAETAEVIMNVPPEPPGSTTLPGTFSLGRYGVDVVRSAPREATGRRYALLLAASISRAFAASTNRRVSSIRSGRRGLLRHVAWSLPLPPTRAVQPARAPPAAPPSRPVTMCSCPLRW